MAGDIDISQENIDKLTMIQEFIDELYSGKQHNKPRIAYISNTLNNIIKELKSIQENKQ